MLEEWDVIVVGAGNAGASAAVSAQENGAKVLVLEKAPKEYRGGNTRLMGAIFRFPNNGIEDIKRSIIPYLSDEECRRIVIPPYTEEDFYRDIMKVTQGLADPDLTKLLVDNARPTIDWMVRNKIEFELHDYVVEHNGKKYYEPGVPVRAKGSGPGLVDMWFKIMEERNIQVMYESAAIKILVNNKGEVTGVRIKNPNNELEDLEAKAVILASGSFEANPELRARYLGKNWDLVKIRGSRWNTGEALMAALEIGAQPDGQWTGCHCSQIHKDSPKVEADDWRKRHSLYSWMWGVIVNKEGKRFVDEGEDWPLHIYAKLGRIIFEKQPEGIAYQVFDAKPLKNRDNLLLRRYYEEWISYIEAESLEELADKLRIPRENFIKTIEEYNRSIDETVEFNPTTLDHKSTRGLPVNKSNWARKIDTPPFRAYPVTGGLTFTFGGLKINTKCEVLDLKNKPIRGLYAAGEIAAGIFFYNYCGGTGATWGSVTGRISGITATKYAKMKS